MRRRACTRTKVMIYALHPTYTYYIGTRIGFHSNNLTHHINIVRVDWRPIGRANPSRHDERRRPDFPVTSSTGPAITTWNKIAFSNNRAHNEDDHAGHHADRGDPSTFWRWCRPSDVNAANYRRARYATLHYNCNPHCAVHITV